MTGRIIILLLLPVAGDEDYLHSSIIVRLKLINKPQQRELHCSV